MDGADMETNVGMSTQEKPDFDSKNEGTPMLEAYKLVKSGQSSIRNAARIHHISESTLRSRLKNPNLFESSIGHPPLLSKEEEMQIVEHLQTMSNMGYSFSRSQVLELAAKVAKIAGKEKTPKKDWYYGFLRRFPDVALKKVKKKNISKSTVAKKNNNKYFDDYKAVLEERGLEDKAENIWNVEVVGISLNHTPDVAKEEKPFCVSPGRNVTSTVILAGNAVGETIPPFIIYKGQRLKKELITGCITQSQFAVTSSGWPDTQIFEEFIEKLFIPHVGIRPCIILYDGNCSYINDDTVQKIKEKNIQLFGLPPLLFKQLQPADSGMFTYFKASMIEECEKILNKTGHLSRHSIPQLIADAFQASMTVANLTNAYKSNGLFPFDPSAISREKTKVIKRGENVGDDDNKITVKKQEKQKKIKKIFSKDAIAQTSVRTGKVQKSQKRGKKRNSNNKNAKKKRMKNISFV